MTSLRKAITTLVPLATDDSGFLIRNQFKTPESDKPVRYNSNGFVELSTPMLFCPNNFLSTTVEANYLQFSYTPNFNGGFFNTDVTLHPAHISPFRRLIITTDGASTLTLPDPDVLLAYLREAFTDLPIGGLSWEITFMNNSTAGAGDLTVTVPPPGSGTAGRTGFNNGNSHTIQEKTSALLTFVILNSTPGSENIRYIFS